MLDCAILRRRQSGLRERNVIALQDALLLYLCRGAVDFLKQTADPLENGHWPKTDRPTGDRPPTGTLANTGTDTPALGLDETFHFRLRLVRLFISNFGTHH